MDQILKKNNCIVQVRERSNDDDSTKTSIKKWIRAASNFIALIPSRSILQMLAIISEVEFLKYCLRVQEKKKKVVVQLCSSPTKREFAHFHVVVV